MWPIRMVFFSDANRALTESGHRQAIEKKFPQVLPGGAETVLVARKPVDGNLRLCGSRVVTKRQVREDLLPATVEQRMISAILAEAVAPSRTLTERGQQLPLELRRMDGTHN